MLAVAVLAWLWAVVKQEQWRFGIALSIGAMLVLLVYGAIRG